MNRKTFLAEINEIARNTRNVITVKQAMKRIIKITNQVTHSICIIDFLKALKRKKIGTNAIESSIRKLCGKGPGRKEILELVLRNRINEKYKEMRKNRYNCIKTWRENDDILIQESILEGFLVIWSKEKMR